MTDTVTVALISSGATLLTAAVALILNARTFGTLDRRIAAIEADNKEFFRWFGRLEAGIARIKDHIGLKP
jgi:hypothetical protein